VFVPCTFFQLIGIFLSKEPTVDGEHLKGVSLAYSASFTKNIINNMNSIFYVASRPKVARGSNL
jgi:hypothetical protein